jgi:hypothetical protein
MDRGWDREQKDSAQQVDLDQTTRYFEICNDSAGPRQMMQDDLSLMESTSLIPDLGKNGELGLRF